MSARIIQLREASVAAAIRKFQMGQLPRRRFAGGIHTGQLTPACATPMGYSGGDPECSPPNCDLPAWNKRKVPGWTGDCKTLALTLTQEDVDPGADASIEVTSKPFASSGVAGQTTLRPGMCANELSGFCEWNGPPEKPPPDGRRTTIGTGVFAR